MKSLRYVIPSAAGAIMATTPAYIYLFSFFLFHIGCQRVKLVATFMAIAGNLIIMF